MGELSKLPNIGKEVERQLKIVYSIIKEMGNRNENNISRY